jgi:hypothetical protein
MEKISTIIFRKPLSKDGRKRQKTIISQQQKRRENLLQMVLPVLPLLAVTSPTLFPPQI